MDEVATCTCLYMREAEHDWVWLAKGTWTKWPRPLARASTCSCLRVPPMDEVATCACLYMREAEHGWV